MKVRACKPSRECHCGISRDCFSKNGKLVKLEILDIFVKVCWSSSDSSRCFSFSNAGEVVFASYHSKWEANSGPAWLSHPTGRDAAELQVSHPLFTTFCTKWNTEVLRDRSVDRGVLFSAWEVLDWPTGDSALTVRIDFIRVISLASEWTACCSHSHGPSSLISQPEHHRDFLKQNRCCFCLGSSYSSSPDGVFVAIWVPCYFCWSSCDHWSLLLLLHLLKSDHFYNWKFCNLSCYMSVPLHSPQES